MNRSLATKHRKPENSECDHTSAERRNELQDPHGLHEEPRHDREAEEQTGEQEQPRRFQQCPHNHRNNAGSLTQAQETFHKERIARPDERQEEEEKRGERTEQHSVRKRTEAGENEDRPRLSACELGEGEQNHGVHQRAREPLRTGHEERQQEGEGGEKHFRTQNDECVRGGSGGWEILHGDRVAGERCVSICLVELYNFLSNNHCLSTRKNNSNGSVPFIMDILYIKNNCKRMKY